MALRASILILNYNGLEDTRECLRSLEQDGCRHHEILTLDNGSRSDECALLRQEFPGIILRSDKNLGYAGGNNFLVRQATGDILIFLNNDVEVAIGWATPLLAAFDDSSVSACQPKMLSWSNRSRFDPAGCGGLIDALGYPYARGRIFNSIEFDRGQYDDVVDLDWLSGAALAVRREQFIDLGGFDESFFAYMEEIDLCWRLRARGHRLICAPQSIVFHKGARTLRRRMARKRFLEHRNNLIMLAKNASPLHVLVAIPLRLCLEWIASVYYLFSGQWRWALSPVLAFFAFFGRLPSIFRTRHHAKARRSGVASIIVQYFLFGRTTWEAVHRHTKGSERMNTPQSTGNAARMQTATVFQRPRSDSIPHVA